MFISDLKKDFYNVLIGKRVLIIVNYDLDAICASKILQCLFQYDHMQYSVVPIMGLSGMQRAYAENRDEVKFVVLINCGVCVDVVELLQPDEEVVFYVCDSHRPMDVCNVYSDSQIRILGNMSGDEGIPPFETIFRDEDDEQDDSGHEDEPDEPDGGGGGGAELSAQGKRIERIERQMQRRRQLKQWEDERNRVMFQYTQYSYYGRCSALLVFELAWKLSKDSMDLLWWAIVGITEQLLLGKIESSAYTMESEQIQSHVARLTKKSSDQTMQTALKIQFENDLHLALYRHWSVHDSLKHSMYPACRLRLWTLRGEKRLHELLVEMGLPLVQAKQTFGAMSLDLRKEFHRMVEKNADKYGIPNIVFGSFTLQYGYRNRYAASDYVHALLAILESVHQDRTPEFCFWEALDALTRTNKALLDGGIDLSKKMLAAIFRQVQSSLEMHQVSSAGPFLYIVLSEENPHFACPYGLTMLGKFMLNGYVALARNRRARELPLVACCPVDVERGLCLMVGVAPACEDSPKNFFGKAFEQAGQKSGALISQDFFDGCVAQIRQGDITKFLDGLTVLLS